jgi:hypothetical protein
MLISWVYDELPCEFIWISLRNEIKSSREYLLQNITLINEMKETDSEDTILKWELSSSFHANIINILGDE